MKNVSLSKDLQEKIKVKKQIGRESQKSKVLKHLLSGESITPGEALGRYGCFRLAHIIWKLREQGYDIETTLIRKYDGSGNYAEYTLMQEK